MVSGFGVILGVLSNRNYRWYLGGNLCSTTGNWIQRIAMGWLTWELTGSGAWLGIIAFVDLFPTFAIGLIAGAICDRTDAMRMLRIIQVAAMVQGAGLAAVTFMGIVSIEWLVVFALARGIITAFNRPPRMTIVYQISGREMLSSAIALNSMVFNSSRFIGPAIGGALVASAGVGWAFAANAASYVIFFVALMMIRIVPDSSEETTPRRERPGLIASSAAGLRYVCDTRAIFTALVILTGMSFFARPFTELLPGFASEVFGRGVDAFSTMLSLHGIGAVGGSFFLARRSGTQGLTRIALWALAITAVALMLFTTVASYPLALVLMAVTGATIAVQGIAIQTLIQTSIDANMRGRVMSVYGIVARGSPALGALAMGLASTWLGLNGPVLAGAVICVLIWLWGRGQTDKLSKALENDSAAMAPRATDG